MRIIGGKYRGKKLVSPQSNNVRPTSDKAREALFNILRNRLGSDFASYKLLDVFSGSGAFALEALSQGFAEVTMLDIDTTDLQKNVKLFPLEKNKIKVIKADINSAICPLDKFDVVFMDAPYNKGLSEIALQKIKPWLKDKAICIVEVEKNEPCSLPEGYDLVDERRYGPAKIILAEFTC